MKKEEVFREEIPRPYSSFINELDERIRFLEQCLDNKEKVNKSLRDEISKITMVADDEKQSIEHILELEEENKKLKEERDFFKEQATLWRNDYKNEYEENKNLKEELEKERLFKEGFKDAADKNQKLIAIQHNKIEELEKEIEELNKMMLFETKI